jgi:hypothetical protein
MRYGLTDHEELAQCHEPGILPPPSGCGVAPSSLVHRDALPFPMSRLPPTRNNVSEFSPDSILHQGPDSGLRSSMQLTTQDAVSGSWMEDTRARTDLDFNMSGLINELFDKDPTFTKSSRRLRQTRFKQ